MARKKNRGRPSREDRGPDGAAMRAAREGRPPAAGGIFAMTLCALSRTLAALFELRDCVAGPARDHWRAVAAENIEATISFHAMLAEDHLGCAPEFDALAEALRLINGEVERLMDDGLRELLQTDQKFREITDHLESGSG